MIIITYNVYNEHTGLVGSVVIHKRSLKKALKQLREKKGLEEIDGNIIVDLRVTEILNNKGL